MPPETPPIPTPQGRGSDALLWLKAHGIIPSTPSLRSSSIVSCQTDPFQFYLSNILGLTKALFWSDSLAHGSWFHKALELWKPGLTPSSPPPEFTAAYQGAVDARVAELTAVCDSLGVTGDSKATILQNEQEAAQTALAWFKGSSKVCVPNSAISNGWANYLSSSFFEDLGAEIFIRYHAPAYKQCPIEIRLDRLLYHKTQRLFFILDAKTTSSLPSNRMAACPVETQTWLYSLVIRNLCDDGTLQREFDVPRDSHLGGMLHLVVQKPQIRLSPQDRDCTLVEKEITRGPNKGEIRTEKVYSGEPRFENYLKRVEDWYLASGTYEHKQAERDAEPPVNLSYTKPSFLRDESWQREFRVLLDTAYRWHTKWPVPENFPRTASSVLSYNTPSDYAPFALVEPVHWPEIIAREGFIQKFRDERAEPRIDH